MAAAAEDDLDSMLGMEEGEGKGVWMGWKPGGEVVMLENGMVARVLREF